VIVMRLRGDEIVSSLAPVVDTEDEESNGAGVAPEVEV